jgi:hypothetical protein
MDHIVQSAPTASAMLARYWDVASPAVGPRTLQDACSRHAQYRLRDQPPRGVVARLRHQCGCNPSPLALMVWARKQAH